MKLFVCLYLFSSSLIADTYLSIYGASKHLDSVVTFNESNHGVGITREFSDASSITVGAYKNSLSKTSTVLTYNAKYSAKGGVSVGVSAGVATGYRKGIVPILYPFINMGVIDIGYIPELDGITPAVVFASLKFKIGE